MAEFSIMPASARKHENELDKYANLLADYSDQVIRIKNSLCKMGSSTGRIKAALQEMASQMTDEQKSMNDLSKKLIEIITTYESTEKNICAQTDIRAREFSDTGDAGIIDSIGDIVKMLWQKLQEDIQDPIRKTVILFLADMNPLILLSLYTLPEDMKNYILDALEQAIFGDFSDKSNLLGITLSVGIGFIPIVGQIADIRDLIADIYNLIDDGPVIEEWVALGFTVVGLIPGFGDFLKQGDEAGDLVKGIFKNFDNVDEMADGVKGFMKKGEDVFSAVAKKLNGLKHDAGDIIDKVIESNSVSKGIRDGINGVGDWIKNTDVYNELDDWIGNKLKVGSGEYEETAKDLLEGIVDEYKQDMGESLVSMLLKWIIGSNGRQEAATT